MKHTKLPWKYRRSDFDGFWIDDIKMINPCGPIAKVFREEDNAKFIVQACNNFCDLVTTLKSIVEILDSGWKVDTTRAKEVIAKAEGRIT